MNKLLLVLTVLFISVSSFSQTVPCGEIVKKSKDYGKHSVSGFGIKGTSTDFVKFGIFYHNLRPYIACTPDAMHNFNRGVMFEGFQYVALIGGAVLLGTASNANKSVQTSYFAGTGVMFGLCITSVVFKYINIGRSIKIHNSHYQD